MEGYAYYNENDEHAADWLDELRRAGHIADGAVDRRSIVNVGPGDVAGFRHCHFFAGIGGWAYALKLAGWPAWAEVWTGSCPCQPFSGAGARQGFDDGRHLWPEWYRLIVERRPAVIFGEQVANGDGVEWLDVVFADLEKLGYAVGAADLCAAGVGAPHARQRLWFVAISEETRRGAWRRPGALQGEREPGREAQQLDRRGHDGVAHAEGFGSRQGRGDAGDEKGARRGRRLAQRRSGSVADSHGDGWEAHRRADGPKERTPAESGGDAQRRGVMGDPMRDGAGEYAGKLPGDETQHEVGPADGDHAPIATSAARGLAYGDGDGDGLQRLVRDRAEARPAVGSGVTRGFWRDAEWISCSDGKSRPTEPGVSPLAYGLPDRVGRLRGYGNAITPPTAAVFIRVVMDIIGIGGE